MKKKEILHLKEKVFEDISDLIQKAEFHLPLNHPVRNELSHVRMKLYSALKMNRQNKHEAQGSWVYVVETEVPL